MSEDRTEEENKQIKESRMNAFSGILKEQFQLAYFGHISYEASEGMSVSEREHMYHILMNQKSEERKQQEEAIKAAKAKKSQSSGSKGRRKR